MKAIVKKSAGPGLVMENVPIPTIGDHEVLIKIRKTGICGTDVHIYNWSKWAEKTLSPPLVIGHEFMGEIAEVGKGVHNLKKGARVSGEGHLTCGHCINCRKEQKHLCLNTIGIGVQTQGCFAEYLKLPAKNVFLLPDFVEDDIAAIFDPYGNAVHTVLSFPLPGEDVLITGAGPIGIMAAAIAKKAGARHVIVTDVNDSRLKLAKKMGATSIVNVAHTHLAEAVKAIGLENGFSVGLEMSGSQSAFASMLEVMQHGGNIALLGLLPPNTTIDWDLVIFKMLKIKGIYGREIFSTWYQMTHLLESGLEISPVITHHFPAEEFEEGFQAMISGKAIKVIFDW